MISFIRNIKLFGSVLMSRQRNFKTIFVKQTLRKHSSPTSVDLVPVFKFRCQEVLSDHEVIFKVLKDCSAQSHPFFLIPKPYKGDGVLHAEKLWRIDFHHTEKDILIGYSKNIVKVLKVMRNGNSNSEKTGIEDPKKSVNPRANMSGISSYCLKNVVMLMLRKNSDLTRWNEANSVELLFEALKFLAELLKNRFVPYYFHEECNLLWSESLKKRSPEMANWLQRTIKKMEAAQNTAQCKTVWRECFGI